MDRQVISNLDEREFVTSLIMSDKCCQILIPFIKMTYFDCEYTRIVTQWVIEYFNKFGVSPKKDVLSLYRVHCDQLNDEALKDLVLKYLQKISDSEFTINNEDYLLDKSRNFIDYKALQNYTEDLNACLQTKDMDKARQIQSDYRKVSVVETNEIDLMDKNCLKSIIDALTKTEEVLFKLPGELNKVVGDIHRGDFIAVLAAMKRGKSWCLQQIGLEAMRQQLNVVFISMEMSCEEVVQRNWKMLFGARSGIIPTGTYQSHKFVEDSCEQGKYSLQPVDIVVTEKQRPSTEQLQKQLRAMNNYTGHFRVIAYPAFGASVKDITEKVEELAQDGFIADVLIIDYADITKPIGGGSEIRNQLDLTWKHLRGFAAKFHCAVITASQTNRSGISSSVIGGEAISEDIRKLAHVTSMIALEQTPKMKQDHLMRVRNIAMRNGEAADTCVFTQCLGLGQFMFSDAIPGNSLMFDDEEEDDEDDS